ncbi:Clavaminate synthase-like protein [Mrakia frigida]|uniref:Clavaminate synthase-like protein n=1 Tax=Mrakia frigida TaxID=29902 RepID=UPI003FCBFD42
MPSSSRLPSFPFPPSTSTHPLLVVDYSLLTLSPTTPVSKAESDKLFHACTTLGFFYLKNHGLREQFNSLFDVCEEVFALEEEEKKKYDVGVSGNSFGYKSIGHDNVDEEGNVDTNEQFNLSHDDLLSFPKVVHNEYPEPVKKNAEKCLAFTSGAHGVTMTLLTHLERHLQLPPKALVNLHPQGDGFASPTKARVIRNPPQAESSTLALGSHTDFGSISILDNNMTGGLQVLPPGSDDWQFVQPLEGHVICNLADALAILSGGVLRSNLHRVLPPPGEQRVCTRWSGIFFLVPEFETVLSPLSSLSPIIAEGAKTMTNAPEPGMTCEQWFHRRLFGVRASNRKGPESWLGSRGTEHIVVKGSSARAHEKRLEEGFSQGVKV